MEQVRLSSISMGVSDDTTAEQLRRLPDPMAEVVNCDPLLARQSCRLMKINDDTDNIVFQLHGGQHTLNQFRARSNASTKTSWPTSP